MNRAKTFWALIALGLFSLAIFAARSPGFSLFSPYSLAESHTVAPIWESAARHEPFFRCSRHYASGEAQCTSLSVMVDSLFIRWISAQTGRTPPVTDPEFVDPTLQWFLVLKHGVVVTLLLLLATLLVSRITGS